jgi:hypothetical protein
MALTDGSERQRVFVNENLLDGGIVLMLFGLLLLAVGSVLSGSAFWYAARQWLRSQEKAPSELVRLVLGQAGAAATAASKAASEAGVKAWNEASSAP